jgi:hypothetical protein
VFDSADLIKQFFDSYGSVLSNKQKKTIKKFFIKGIEILKKLYFLEDDYQIISVGHFHNAQELIPRNISEDFVVYEKISYESI